jgi:hypothetical protein
VCKTEGWFVNLVTLFSEPAVGSALGVLGIVAAVFFYIRGKREKKFVYTNKENVIIGEAKNLPLNKLKVMFDGIDVNQVTRSVFVIWNAGRSTIRKNDIAESDPLRITLPTGTRILATSVDLITRKANNVSLSINQNKSEIILSFDFLDFRDGANLSVVHSAPSGQCTFEGTVLGMPDGVKNWGPSIIDIERYQTPRPSKPWFVRLPHILLLKTIKWTLLLLPWILFVCAIFTGPVVKAFPSFGKPDTTGMLIPGHVSWFWVTVSALLICGELVAVKWALQVPPKKLTTNGVRVEMASVKEDVTAA